LSRYDGGTTTTTVPAVSNKISAVGGTSYSYDSAGNITADGTNTYVWNAAGQMKEVKVGGLTVGDYVYNASNQRTAKLASGSTQQFVYGKGGLLYGEYDNTGALVREYIYLNGSPLAQVDAGSPEVLTYLHTDHLGTPRFGTNTAGTQVWSWYSDAFGVGAPSGSRTVNLRMPGQYYDSQSGLFYNWNRYYNPATGRYVSSDPIGLEGGLNTFNYVEASPVMYSDPEGKFIPLLIGLAEETAACLANPICRSILIDIASVATSPQPRPDDKGMCAGDYVPSANANTADEGEKTKILKEKAAARPNRNEGGSWRVNVKCNVSKGIDALNCPNTIGGVGYGNSKAAAVIAAQKDANDNLADQGAKNCQKRHCDAQTCYYNGAQVPCR